MEQTIAIALQHVGEQGGRKIHRLELAVGELSGVVPDALAFAFDVVSQGTAAEGAELALTSIPVQCYCQQCQQFFYPESWFYNCPCCQQVSSDIRQGKHLELASLEIS